MNYECVCACSLISIRAAGSFCVLCVCVFMHALVDKDGNVWYRVKICSCWPVNVGKLTICE